VCWIARRDARHQRLLLTNAIARASETMAKCSQELVHGASKMAAE
jgi:hypothetical protein